MSFYQTNNPRNLLSVLKPITLPAKLKFQCDQNVSYEKLFKIRLQCFSFVYCSGYLNTTESDNFGINLEDLISTHELKKLSLKI